MMSALSTEKTTKQPANAPKSSGLGLDGLGDLSSLLGPASNAVEGEAIELPLSNVEEDLGQPRKTFSEDEMVELTESIKAHGVMVPINVYRHPEIEGRFIINDGARRYRATGLAEKQTIPAVIGKKFTRVQQIVVNKVREDTPPMDKARAFHEVMQETGCTQKQLAEQSKLSEAYVSQHLALLKLPTPVAQAFDTGRCTDVTLINEVSKAFKKKPEAVKTWLADEEQEITRGSVRLLRDFLEEKNGQVGASEEDEDGASAGESKSSPEKTPKEKSEKEPDPEKIKKAIILGTYKKRPVRLLTNKRWTGEGFAWVRYEDDGQEIEIELGELKLNRLLEA